MRSSSLNGAAESTSNCRAAYLIQLFGPHSKDQRRRLPQRVTAELNVLVEFSGSLQYFQR